VSVVVVVDIVVGAVVDVVGSGPVVVGESVPPDMLLLPPLGCVVVGSSDVVSPVIPPDSVDVPVSVSIAVSETESSAAVTIS